MLIAIVGLALVAVFMAQKRNAADADLPPPGGVPATGTSGVPSPGPEQTGNLAGSTSAGKVAMLTNGGLVGTKGLEFNKYRLMGALGNENVSNVPQGPPDQAKSLDTQYKPPMVLSGGNVPSGYKRI